MFASNNHHQVFRQLNNENSQPVLSSVKNKDASATSKTPAPSSSKQRRALGDISNRKQGRLGNTIKSGSELILASKTDQTPVLRLVQQKQQQQRIPLSTKTPGLSKRTEVSFLPRPTQVHLAASSVNIFPDLNKNKSDNTSERPVSKSILKNKVSTKSTTRSVEDRFDEIEKPAGRLWIDDPDDESVTSVSLPGALTVLEDWEAACQKRHALRMKLQDEEERRAEAAFADYEKKLFEDDDEAILGADVWIEQTLNFDDIGLDEELSFDAPSYCVDISF